jgi:hypothetical protein
VAQACAYGAIMPSIPRQPSSHRIEITTPGQPSSRAKESRLDRISQRAHRIYERRGGQHGRDLDDWLQAEREIDAEDEQS